MEVFNETGTKINTIQFPNHGGDGSGTDPSPVPVMTDHLDLKVHIDNKPLTFELLTPATNPCGVVPWSQAITPTFEFSVQAAQENGRVHEWQLYYTKGIDSTPRYTVPSGNIYNAGTATVNEKIPGSPLLVDSTTSSGQLESTCAFALVLRAWSHVRVNYGFQYYGEKVYAIAIEKCDHR